MGGREVKRWGEREVGGGGENLCRLRRGSCLFQSSL